MRPCSRITSYLKVFSRRATTESRGGACQPPFSHFPSSAKTSGKHLTSVERLWTIQYTSCSSYCAQVGIDCSYYYYVNLVYVVSISYYCVFESFSCVIFPSSCLIVGDCAVLSNNDALCFHCFHVYVPAAKLLKFVCWRPRNHFRINHEIRKEGRTQLENKS